MLPIYCNYIIDPSLILTYTIRPTVSLLQTVHRQSPVSIIFNYALRACVSVGICVSVDVCDGMHVCLRQCGCVCVSVGKGLII